jgi:hypothetical protein
MPAAKLEKPQAGEKPSLRRCIGTNRPKLVPAKAAPPAPSPQRELAGSEARRTHENEMPGRVASDADGRYVKRLR